jgi:hypothetical protein
MLRSGARIRWRRCFGRLSSLPLLQRSHSGERRPGSTQHTRRGSACSSGSPTVSCSLDCSKHGGYPTSSIRIRCEQNGTKISLLARIAFCLNTMASRRTLCMSRFTSRRCWYWCCSQSVSSKRSAFRIGYSRVAGPRRAHRAIVHHRGAGRTGGGGSGATR